MELLAFYKFSFLVALLSSGGLSLIGKHNFSRGTVLEIFFLSQLSIFGNLFSKLCFESHFLDWKGILFSYLFFAIGKFYLLKVNYSNHKLKNLDPFMIGGYLFLLALQYLIIGAFPQLDAHMSVGLFGNMVTASFLENLSTCLIFGFFFIIYFIKNKEIKRNTLEKNILNQKANSLSEGILLALPLITSLYSLGFLYTMSFLLLPALLIGDRFHSEKKASFFIAFNSIFAAILGLYLSISFENLSTTSVQIFILFLSLIVTRFTAPIFVFRVSGVKSRKNRKSIESTV